MAVLDDAKERLKEVGTQIMQRVQESSAWSQLTEKYYNLSPVAQKASLAGAGVASVLLLMIFPGCFYMSSQDHLADYESKRHTVHELFRVSHEAGSLPPPPPMVTAMDLESRARQEITGKIQAEQLVSITSSPAADVPGVSKTLQQASLTVSLKKLNLTQLIDFGHELQTLHPMARLIGMTVKASSDDAHYFDVIYRIVAFSSKPESIGSLTGGKAGAKGGKPSFKKPGGGE